MDVCLSAVHNQEKLRDLVEAALGFYFGSSSEKEILWSMAVVNIQARTTERKGELFWSCGGVQMVSKCSYSCWCPYIGGASADPSLVAVAAVVTYTTVTAALAPLAVVSVAAYGAVTSASAATGAIATRPESLWPTHTLVRNDSNYARSGSSIARVRWQDRWRIDCPQRCFFLDFTWDSRPE